jgi:hypothetical protein
MAQRTIVELADDLDGSEAHETVSFGLDGVNYKIDLSRDNAARLRDRLAAYVAHGQRTGNAGRRVRTSVASTTDFEQNQQIRIWARQAGLPINDRGRIPAGIIEKFQAAQG